MLEQPQVRQALTAVLGENYLLHGHRHLHVSASSNQMWHKDSYWGLRKVRRHRPRWCMMLYYPPPGGLVGDELRPLKGL